MNSFQEIEALTIAAGADSPRRAKVLLARFRTSEARSSAIDEFLLELMTLVFVIEHGEQDYEQSLRKLALLKLAKVKRLVPMSVEDTAAS